MITTAQLRAGISEIGYGLRRPEELAIRWRDRHRGTGSAPPAIVFLLLLATAILGISAYGLTIGLHAGALSMLAAAIKAPFAAGLAWTIALPALYIVNSWLGSRLDASTTLLAALATVSFGGLAMLASIPINWFFTLAVPFDGMRAVVNFVVFTGVGICMSDVFLRVMKALEPDRSRAYAVVWLVLVGAIGGELMALVKLFAWEAP